MKYFRLKFMDCIRACEAVWTAQDATGQPHTAFHISAEGSDTTVWTTNPAGESLLRKQLDLSKIPYEEANEQQVVTFLDKYFQLES